MEVDVVNQMVKMYLIYGHVPEPSLPVRMNV